MYIQLAPICRVPFGVLSGFALFRPCCGLCTMFWVREEGGRETKTERLRCAERKKERGRSGHGRGREGAEMCFQGRRQAPGIHPSSHPAPASHPSTSMHSFIHLSMHAFVRSLVHSVMHACIHSFNHETIQPFLDLLVHLFIHSFIHLSIHPSIHPSILMQS